MEFSRAHFEISGIAAGRNDHAAARLDTHPLPLARNLRPHDRISIHDQRCRGCTHPDLNLAVEYRLVEACDERVAAHQAGAAMISLEPKSRA